MVLAHMAGCWPLFLLALVPAAATSKHAPGLCAGHVLFYDLDGKLDIVRLMEVGQGSPHLCGRVM